MQITAAELADYRAQLTDILGHLDHLLPGQGPILDFVHHNTLHGYQHLPFDQALAAAEQMTGVCGYLPEQQYRQFYRQGRIDDSDLSAALAYHGHLNAGQSLAGIKREAVYRIALLHELSPLNSSQLNWHIQELNALTKVQPDVPESVREQLLAGANEADTIRQLWHGIIDKLDLQLADLHPEALLKAAGTEPSQTTDLDVHPQTRKQAELEFDRLIAELGVSITLRGLVQALSGIDTLDCVRPQLLRICASALDEGVAAWHLPERNRLGVYAAWRAIVPYDANLFLHQLPDWQDIIAELPEHPLDAISLQLLRLNIPHERWSGYLRCLSLELPGWSGFINWRQQHPNYRPQDTAPTLADYLAIRLTLDRLWLNQVCHDLWKVEAKVSALQTYFRKNLSEFWVRKQLHQGDLPEYLTELAEALIIRAGSERQCRSDWQQLADLLHIWRLNNAGNQRSGHSAADSGWRLFRLCQHLGFNAAKVGQLAAADLHAILALLDGFNATERSKVWLYAYERHYRETFLQALQANHRRGRWAERKRRPQAQLIFCMDDREEGFRRHLEEFNTAIETLGAAGFFGIPINYQGLDDNQVTPLCPVVVTPAHEVHEQARPGAQTAWYRHNRGRQWLQRGAGLWHQDLRRQLWSAYPVVNALAPLSLFGLLGKSLWPKAQQTLLTGVAGAISPTVGTFVQFNAGHKPTAPEREQNQPGFTDAEQADRVAGFLTNTGLTYGFAELVVLMGHGSLSQNNPHIAAYDCGACSGRHGGPNARVFAAMANRPAIRKLLAERGIDIPADTWFIGAEHNTCNEAISWYDLDDLPIANRAALQALQSDLQHAQRLSAHERCRRLASAPRNPSPAQALAHIQQRATDFSQARPELGHATNAAAVIGRRALTQGVFFDRRVFLISYDPTQDPDGKVLESILLAVGPVGAGINLEYYFSTVNNEHYGCGTKIPHNITGLFAVMEGTGSDLRTGLPQQMVEIHEAMRLQILVEVKTAVLEQIYARQESLRELIAGRWVHLSVKDPDSGEIFLFEPGQGFTPWQNRQPDLPTYPSSPACYGQQTQPVPPALIGHAH